MAQLRPTLTNVPPAVHGARNYRELSHLGLDPEAVVDFSANSNPYGPHPAVLHAVRTAVTEATIAHYPDRDCLALTTAIATAEGVKAGNVLPGNGAAELIQLIALASVTPQCRHLVLAPTFGEYARQIQLLGGQVIEHRPSAANLRFDPETAAAAIRRLQPATVWLCNPNNPTGQQWTAAELAALMAADPGQQSLWVIDESYRYFAAEQVSLAGSLTEQNNIIILRSLTKEHALAGLRLGYALAAPPLIDALRQVQPPWSVNSLAQVAGTAALEPEITGWRQESLDRLRRDAASFWLGLAALGYSVLPSTTSYALVEVGDAPAFRRHLLSHRLLVRDGTSFGLPGHVRIAARQLADNERLLAALKHP